MRILIYILLALGLASVVYNATNLDFDNLMFGESQISLYSIIIALCSMILLVILLLSLKVRDKVEASKKPKSSPAKKQS